LTCLVQYVTRDIGERFSFAAGSSAQWVPDALGGGQAIVEGEPLDPHGAWMRTGQRAGSALALLLFVSVLMAPARARGQSEKAVEIHGFVSQGFIKSTENNYLGPSERGSFEFTEAAVNFTHSPLDELRIGVQLFARDIGPFGNYEPRFDWYYLDYTFFDWLRLRAGRIKIPFGLYNEVNDVDAARVPVLLPQSIYSVANREYLLALTGAELYGEAELGAGGSLAYHLYGGTIHLDPADVGLETAGSGVPYVVGGRLMWSPPIEGLSLGGSLQALRIDLQDAVLRPEQIPEYVAGGLLPPDTDGTISAGLPVVLGVASVQYEPGDVLLAAEYMLQSARFESDLLVPRIRLTDHAFYILGAYRLTPWLTPGAYYSLRLPDPYLKTGPQKYQHDVALTLRFDVNAHWLFKVEGHYMNGTLGLSPDLNDGVVTSELPSSWGVLLLKTTAYF
jgi:hypothetical protein